MQRFLACGLGLADILVPLLVLYLDGYPGGERLYEEEIKKYTWAQSVIDIAIICIIRGVLMAATAVTPRYSLILCLRALQLVSGVLLIFKAGFFEMWGSHWQETLIIFGLVGSLTEVTLILLIPGPLATLPRREAGVTGSLNNTGYAPLKDPAQDELKEESKEHNAGDSESVPRKNVRVTVKRMLRLAKPEACILITATCALFVASGAQMVVPALFGSLISSISDGQNEDHHQTEHKLDRIVLSMLGVFVILNIFQFFRVWLFQYAGERLVARFRKQVFESLAYQDIGFFDKTNSSELVNRLASDTSSIQSVLTVNMSMALRWIVQTVVGITILFVLSPTLTGIMMAVVPAIAIGAVVFGRFVRNISRAYQKALAEAGMVAGESLGNIRTVRSFANEPKETQRYTEKIGHSFDFGRKRATAFGYFSAGVGLVAFLAITMVLWYGGRLVIQGHMKSGELLSFLLYTIFIAFALGGLASLYGTLMSAIGASERMFKLLDRVPEINSRHGLLPMPTTDLKGDIRLENVEFSYPSRPDRKVLADVTLNCKPGETVALVGQSGAGKSTIIALLERFYEPTQGSIFIDGTPLQNLPSEWIHKRMALVSQEPALFACSIRDNILYGCQTDQVSEDEMQEAAKQANCHEFISKFPEKYDTLVGERGVQLSGGQKQRVAIARALLLKPKILLLDEATSALDAESEFLVTRALDDLMKHCTTIVIAHRLSTVRSADQVLVLSSGRIVERGTHDDLLLKNGIYRQLVERQLTQDAESNGKVDPAGETKSPSGNLSSNSSERKEEMKAH